MGQSSDMTGTITECSEHLKHLELVTKQKPRDFHQGPWKGRKECGWKILSAIVTRKDFYFTAWIRKENLVGLT